MRAHSASEAGPCLVWDSKPSMARCKDAMPSWESLAPMALDCRPLRLVRLRRLSTACWAWSKHHRLSVTSRSSGRPVDPPECLAVWEGLRSCLSWGLTAAGPSCSPKAGSLLLGRRNRPADMFAPQHGAAGTNDGIEVFRGATGCREAACSIHRQRYYKTTRNAT